MFEWQRLNSFTRSSQLDKVHKGSATVAFPGTKVRVNSKQSKDRRTRAQKKRKTNERLFHLFFCGRIFDAVGTGNRYNSSGATATRIEPRVSTVMFWYYHNVIIIIDSFKHKSYPLKLVSNFCVCNNFYIGIKFC